MSDPSLTITDSLKQLVPQVLGYRAVTVSLAAHTSRSTLSKTILCFSKPDLSMMPPSFKSECLISGRSRVVTVLCRKPNSEAFITSFTIRVPPSESIRRNLWSSYTSNRPELNKPSMHNSSISVTTSRAWAGASRFPIQINISLKNFYIARALALMYGKEHFGLQLQNIALTESRRRRHYFWSVRLSVEGYQSNELHYNYKWYLRMHATQVYIVRRRSRGGDTCVPSISPSPYPHQSAVPAGHLSIYATQTTILSSVIHEGEKVLTLRAVMHFQAVSTREYPAAGVARIPDPEMRSLYMARSAAATSSEKAKMTWLCAIVVLRLCPLQIVVSGNAKRLLLSQACKEAHRANSPIPSLEDTTSHNVGWRGATGQTICAGWQWYRSLRAEISSDWNAASIAVSTRQQAKGLGLWTENRSKSETLI
ncbi:uncharacterized protein HD556DRAFT_1305947 [Suillus plorans]|uniref:Uncharacterized protein n=1 Tax=Suillus plorans TaxID=116603 RepID=A0A9P7IZX2_9AGAM|nr:uncharacterized protein HD556DRAFT_1305947 [Suillus plorans]KAG1798482.1 hypothetical protein HD556DRAFT_1305947 [Suillus plorans]